MNKDDLIYVAGHRGLVGSAVVRELRKQGYEKAVALAGGTNAWRDANMPVEKAG